MPSDVETRALHWSEILVHIGATLLVGLVAWILVNLAIRATVKAAQARATVHAEAKPGRLGQALSASGFNLERTRQRAATMGSILRSIAGFTIAVIVVLTVLATFGVPLAPLLASAGVGGVALGFGAQSLVKDFLSGIAMIVEDQYGVGDFINTGEVSGTVEEISLRVTRLRDPSGTVWYVRNGEIVRIGNQSQGWSTAMVDIPVSYDEDPAKATATLQEMLQGMDLTEAWAAPLLEPPVVLGVESVVGTTMTLRMMIKTAPNQHWGVQRELRLRAKDALAAAGIKGPVVFPT